MALSVTPVQQIETALKSIVSCKKRVINDNVRSINVQIGHQTVVLRGTCSFDVFKKFNMTFVDVFIKICIKIRLFA